MEAAKPSLIQPDFSPLPLQHTTDHPRPLVSVTRRLALSASLSSLVLSFSPTLLRPGPAKAFDFGFVKPGQTVEDAVGAVRGHAWSLLAVKPLLESGSWEEAQREMRESSALLKQDFYTIIQSRPGGERPRLRKLYSDLFNGVSRLDYAARDRDGPRAWRCYEKISAALEEILSLIL
ncbi:psbQ-like protein 3, chloroplastic [Rhodamnia argentea]|uniref:PsbQ-like protein 3, chloroplastic n=1 Tax=Rhodamnia argentea TaxID=178133 RepID=A0A8B8NM35_9MYRT|nr:psbQ-like protein 3, chloroplastic [Rhodamnia argentea]